MGHRCYINDEDNCICECSDHDHTEEEELSCTPVASSLPGTPPLSGRPATTRATPGTATAPPSLGPPTTTSGTAVARTTATATATSPTGQLWLWPRFLPPLGRQLLRLDLHRPAAHRRERRALLWHPWP